MSTTPQWTVGDRLRKARETAGLSQIQLAQAAGFARNTVIRYEAGQADPKRYIVAEIARLTDVPVEWLLDGDEVLRARRDSNPQPSDLESDALCTRCGRPVREHEYGIFCMSRRDWAVAA